MTTRQLRLLLPVAFVCILLTACTAQMESVRQYTVLERIEQVSTFNEVDCATFQVAQAHKQTCGLVEVPADHFNLSDTRRLSIPIVIMSADVEDSPFEATFYLPDGPGGTVLRSAGQLRFATFGVTARTHDIVWIEPRGSWLSSVDLTCWDELAAFDKAVFAQAVSPDEYADGFFTAVETCLRRAQANGVDLALFNTQQDAADVMAIAKALGYEQINLYGVGYGSHVSLELLRRFNHTNLVRSAVLLSPYDAEINPLQANLAFSTQLEKLFERCANENTCNLAFPELRERFVEELLELQENPVLVEAAYHEGVMVPADETVLLNYLFWELQIGSRAITELPMRLDAILNKDYAPLGEGVYFLRYDRAWGVYVANLCQSGLMHTSTQEVLDQMAQLPDAMRNFFLRRPMFTPCILDLCDALSLSRHSPQPVDVVKSEVPTLVLTGDSDPVILPAWSDQATSSLVNRVFVVAANGGHGNPLLLSCRTSSIDRFLQNPMQPASDYCMEESTAFYIPPPKDALVERVPVTFEELNIATQVPQWIAEDFTDSGSYSGLSENGFALTIKRLPATSVEQAVELLSDQLLPGASERSLVIGGRTWIIIEDPMGILTRLFAITELRTGEVYQVEMLLDESSLARARSTSELVTEAVFFPLLEHFQMVDE